MVTTLLSPSLILMQVMVGHWDRSLWNLFHAPSSGKATVTSDSWFSSRIRRGMADNNLKVRECIDTGRERERQRETHRQRKRERERKRDRQREGGEREREAYLGITRSEK